MESQIKLGRVFGVEIGLRISLAHILQILRARGESQP
jgi:hypothetical protein